MQEQVRHLFERGVRRQIFDRVARQRQPAAVAVDFAQSRRRRDDAFQSVCHGSMFDLRSDIVNIDRRINQWRERPHHLTAAHAADLLGVTRATLYAYASRGQLRSEAVPGQPRERRYYREDVQRLLDRKDARRDPAAAAARGLHWGGPVLESGITLIHDGRLYYRGRDALTLAETATLEDAALVLWAADDSERSRLFDQTCRTLPDAADPVARLREGSVSRSCRRPCRLPRESISASYDLRPAAVRLDRRAHREAADRDRRAPGCAAASSPRAAARVGAGPRRGRRRDSSGAGALRGPRVERVGVYRAVRRFRRRVALRCRLGGDGDAQGIQARWRRRAGADAARRVGHARGTRERRSPLACVVASRCPDFGHPLYPNGDPRAVAAAASGRVERTRGGVPARSKSPKGRRRSCCTIFRTSISGWRRSPARFACPIRRRSCCLRSAARSAGSRTRSNNTRQAT